jgi:hypothetical protein
MSAFMLVTRWGEVLKMTEISPVENPNRVNMHT